MSWLCVTLLNTLGRYRKRLLNQRSYSAHHSTAMSLLQRIKQKKGEDNWDDADIWTRDKYGDRKLTFAHIEVPEPTAKEVDVLRNDLDCVCRRVACVSHSCSSYSRQLGSPAS